MVCTEQPKAASALESARIFFSTWPSLQILVVFELEDDKRATTNVQNGLHFFF